jgi:hypothetical protein
VPQRRMRQPALRRPRPQRLGERRRLRRRDLPEVRQGQGLHRPRRLLDEQLRQRTCA